MDAMVLGYTFVAAVVIAACVVRLFSTSIDGALERVIPDEQYSAWRRYIKFALFTVTLVGGMRLSDLAAFVIQSSPTGPAISGGQGLLEVFKTISGSLIAASIALLIFFIVTLAIDASMRVFWFRRESSEKAAGAKTRPAAIGPERQPVGSERHAAGKERARTEDSGRFL